jgi:Flp pilus assembly pilin Flp
MAKRHITLKATTRAQLAVGGWRDTVVARMRKRAGDSGASVVEYGGLLVIVALIVVAVRGLGLQGIISGAISTAVNNITGGG